MMIFIGGGQMVTENHICTMLRLCGKDKGKITHNFNINYLDLELWNWYRIDLKIKRRFFRLTFFSRG